MSGIDCISNGLIKCSSCDAGYYVNVYYTECLKNICGCENGEAAIGIDCLNHGDLKCISCNTGFKLFDGVCVEEACEQNRDYGDCDVSSSQSGSAVECRDSCNDNVDCERWVYNSRDDRCILKNGETDSCTYSYTDSTDPSTGVITGLKDIPCTISQCVCENGVATNGFDCPQDGDTFCASCNNGYFMVSDFFNPQTFSSPSIATFSTQPVSSTTSTVYFFVSSGTSYTWDSANSFCQSLGLEMAAVYSEAENNEIYNLVHSSVKEKAWLGGGINQYQAANSMSHAKNLYTWTNGDSFSFENWAPDEPNGYSTNGNAATQWKLVFWYGNGLGHSDKSWDDLSPDSSNPVVCQMRLFTGTCSNNCICPDGIAENGIECSQPGTNFCVLCNPGFLMRDQKCVSESNIGYSDYQITSNILNGTIKFPIDFDGLTPYSGPMEQNIIIKSDGQNLIKIEIEHFSMETTYDGMAISYDGKSFPFSGYAVG